MTLVLTRRSLHRAAKDLDIMALAVMRAQSFLREHAYSDSEGGFFLSNAGSTLNELRGTLITEYGHGGGGVFGLLDAAADGMRQIWREVERADEQTRREMAQGQGRLDDVLPAPFDGGLVGPGGPGGPGGSPADPGQGAQPPDVEVFTVTGAGYDHFFATPDTSGDPLGRELLDLWRQSQDLISLEWVVSPVRHVGLTNPIEDFREYMDGNFEQLATGMVAVRSLADFWHQMGIDAHQLADALRVAGGGEAVTAAAGWCDDFGSACAEHEIAIKLWAGKIESETALLVDSVDTMISVATTIVESLPSLSFEGDNLIEKGLDLLGSAASSVARAVTRIGNVIKNFLRLFDAFRILAQAFMSLLAQPVDDLTFPEVTPVGSLPGFDDDTDRRRPR